MQSFMNNNCHRCREIVSWLEGRELGRTVRCPICEAMYTRGHNCVVDEAGRPVNEDREKSDRPAYCTACSWTGPMRSTKFLEDDCFPFRCPECGAVVANRKGEE